MFFTLASSSSSSAQVVLDLLAILAAAAIVTTVLRRTKLSTIPGYLLTGALIGPSALGFVSSDESILSITDLAVLLLMFTIGLHLDLSSIRKGMVHILAVGVASTLAIWALGTPMGMAFGLEPIPALAVAMALSMSSTAVALGLLQKRREMHLTHGRICVGVSIVQDLLSIVVLAALPPLAKIAGAKPATASPEPASATSTISEVGALANDAATLASDAATASTEALTQGVSWSTPQLVEMVSSGLLAVGGITGLLIVSKLLLPRMLREVSRTGSGETLLVASAAIALGAAVLTTVLGIGAAMGAFIAGFMLSSTSFRAQISGQLAPMRDLFMAVFFTAVGLKIDFPAIATIWWTIPLALVMLLTLKASMIGLTTWAAGASAPNAALVGLTLSQAGEFTLVVLAAATGLGLLPASVEPALIALVVLTLIVTTPLHTLAHRLGPRLSLMPMAKWITSPSLRDEQPAEGSTPHTGHTAAGPRHVIIAGFGIVGRNLAEHFAVASIPFTIVEMNSATVAKQRKLGRAIVFGDISNPEVLEAAGITRADAVILTIPDDDAMLRACQVIRKAHPTVFIAVRTSYLSQAMIATEMGADAVTIEEVATSNDMAAQVMRRLRDKFARNSAPETVLLPPSRS